MYLDINIYLGAEQNECMYINIKHAYGCDRTVRVWGASSVVGGDHVCWEMVHRGAERQF
jgi:hypothetical protein